jgi:hypothetical protein
MNYLGKKTLKTLYGMKFRSLEEWLESVFDTKKIQDEIVFNIKTNEGRGDNLKVWQKEQTRFRANHHSS